MQARASQVGTDCGVHAELAVSGAGGCGRRHGEDSATAGLAEASNSGIIGVVQGPRAYEKTEARSVGRSVGMPAGGGAALCTIGGGCAFGEWCELLRGRRLFDSGTSPSQTATGGREGSGSDGLWARDGRYDILLDVVLQRPIAAGADSGRVCST